MKKVGDKEFLVEWKVPNAMDEVTVEDMRAVGNAIREAVEGATGISPVVLSVGCNMAGCTFKVILETSKTSNLKEIFNSVDGRPVSPRRVRLAKLVPIAVVRDEEGKIQEAVGYIHGTTTLVYHRRGRVPEAKRVTSDDITKVASIIR